MRFIAALPANHLTVLSSIRRRADSLHVGQQYSFSYPHPALAVGIDPATGTPPNRTVEIA